MILKRAADIAEALYTTVPRGHNQLASLGSGSVHAGMMAVNSFAGSEVAQSANQGEQTNTHTYTHSHSMEGRMDKTCRTRNKYQLLNRCDTKRKTG